MTFLGTFAKRAVSGGLLAVSALLSAPMVHAQTALRLPAQANEIPADALAAVRSLPAGQKLRLENFPLETGATPSLATLELQGVNHAQRAPALFLHDGTTVREGPPSQERNYFTGRLADEPDSQAFMVLDDQGGGYSVVHRGGAVFVSDFSANRKGRAASLQAGRLQQQADLNEQPFSCGVTPGFVQRHATPPSETFVQALHASRERKLLRALPAAAPAQMRRADIIVEVDYELYTRLGRSPQAVQNYVRDLFTYISTYYESEVGARLAVTQINTWTGPAQPWTGSSTDVLLKQLEGYWNDPARYSTARHHVHLLSGKPGGGIAYLDTLGQDKRRFAYGVSTGMQVDFQAAAPQVAWDTVVIAHELGHAFGSDHTHNYDAPYRGSADGGAIDCCYSEGTGQCARLLGGSPRVGVLPGINSRTGGSSGMRQGTLMSYCDLVPGGFGNLSFNFGTSHAYGANAWRVPQVMQSAVQAHLPLDTTPPAQTFKLDVSRTGSGAGLVSSVPAGIQCGSDCSETYPAGTRITLTAAPGAGSSFTGWSGACSGTAATCSVTMDRALQAGAGFALNQTSRIVAVSKAGTGTGQVTSSPQGLSCQEGCSASAVSFPASGPVVLTARPSAGSKLVAWGGACSSYAAQPTCTVAPGSATAQVSVIFDKSGSGGDSSNGPLKDPRDFVNQQYLDFFDRPADGAGLNYWAQQLAAAEVTRPQIIESFMNSAEFSSRVAPLTRLYSAYFQRIPDYAGLTYWLGRMHPAGAAQGLSLAEVSAAFAASPEFTHTYGPLNDTAFVERVYRNVLARAPDAAGRAYWVDRLAQGLSRGDVMVSFSESAENLQATLPSVQVTMTHVGMLRRSPAVADHASWVNEIKAGRTTVEALIASVLASPEYAARF